MYQCIEFHVEGFVLHGLAKESAKQFIEKIFHLCVGNQWKERISEVSTFILKDESCYLIRQILGYVLFLKSYSYDVIDGCKKTRVYGPINLPKSRF